MRTSPTFARSRGKSPLSARSALRNSILSLAVAFLIAVSSASNAEIPYAGPFVVGHLEEKDLTEASGLAVSQLDPNLLWAVNDSGNEPILYLMSTDGTYLGRAEVSGHRNRDWEDLASFSHNGKAYLMIADTGDNLGIHSTSTLAFVEEPPPPSGKTELRVVLPVQWSLTFQYEDGPRDCEAVAVDVKAGKVLLVTKREPVPRLYELPLKSESPETLVAHYLGPVVMAENRRDPFDVRKPPPFLWQPTGLDIAADGSMAVISTYRVAMVYRKKADQSWAEVFSNPPALLPRHGLGGCEDIAISLDREHLYLTSEGGGSPIKQYKRVVPGP